jgi:hypothetical protein
MGEKSFVERAWDMAMIDEYDRFCSLDNATKWVWFETVMNLDLCAGTSSFGWDDLAGDLHLEDRALDRHVTALVERGLLRRSALGGIELPHELKIISPAHRDAKIWRQRPETKLVAVGTG